MKQNKFFDLEFAEAVCFEPVVVAVMDSDGRIDLTEKAVEINDQVDAKDQTEELIRQFGEGSEFGKKQEAKRKECEARVRRIHSKVKNMKTATPAKWVRTT